MKNKAWHIVPFVILFSIVSATFALISLRFSTTLFFVEISIALAGAVASLILHLYFAKYVHRTVRQVVAATKNVDKEYLERFGFPVSVLNDNGDIIWYNSAFRGTFCRETDVLGVPVAAIINKHSITELCGSKGGNIQVGDLKFTAYANPLEKGYVLYFFDDTRLKNIEQEYYDSRPSVLMAVLDNDDAFEDDDEEEINRITSQVESTMSKWTAENNGLYRRISRTRYMMLFEERDLRRIIDNKFDILGKIREIKSGDTGATISIGVGRGENSLRKGQTAAKRALEMALGRGGDQVAVLKNGDYQFFGGKSAGTERHSKARVRVIAKSLLDAVQEADKVIVMGHKFSDLDCMGAAIGLYGAITASLKKDTYIAVDYETSMAKGLIDAYKTICGMGVFVSPREAVSMVDSDTLLIVVDTQSEARVESKELLDKCSRIIVIDHHRMSVDHLKNALVFYHEPNASSASEMCVELIDSFPDVKLKKPEAEALLSGIILDTKNFVINSGSRTFEAAAYLKKHGADTVSVRQLFADSIEIYRNKYYLVSTAKVYKKCAIVIAEEEMKDIRLIASKAADELLGLKGVNASFVMFPTEGNTVNISARSYGKRNVQVIMEKLGGGGHHSMAAAQMKDISFENAMRKLVEAIDGEAE